jgi:hypothetical protein
MEERHASTCRPGTCIKKGAGTLLSQSAPAVEFLRAFSARLPHVAVFLDEEIESFFWAAMTVKIQPIF